MLYLDICVDHSCYQCGAAVEDGTAFCAHCKAPQIRVATPDASSSAALTSAGVAQAGSVSSPGKESSGNVPRIQWLQALPGAFLGLLIACGLSVVLRGAVALGMLTAGFISVYFYRRHHPFFRLTLGFGARLGAISGALGFAILALVSGAATLVFHYGQEIHAQVLKAVQQYLGPSSDPQSQRILEIYSSQQGFIMMLALGAVVMFAVFMALSSVGGMIGAAMLRKRDSV